MGGRLLGHATLAFRDEYLALDERVAVSVTDDPAAVLDLEKACPPDDVAEVGLADMSRALVTLDELDQPTAGAGYAEWEQIIAHLGVLTPPAFRRRGFGQVAAALATNDALDLGLVPQWRARIENRASRSTAARLGFVEVGSQTTVVLTAASD
jgi:GNAT superfamily N-acetyltransferase